MIELFHVFSMSKGAIQIIGDTLGRVCNGGTGQCDQMLHGGEAGV